MAVGGLKLRQGGCWWLEVEFRLFALVFLSLGLRFKSVIAG